MKKPILNYTTKVPAETSIAEISKMLAMNGATAIMQEFDVDGRIVAVSFKMMLNPHSPVGFKLPNHWQAIHKLILADRNPNLRPPHRTEEHAINVSWRIIKDWVEAQLALVAAQQAVTEQVFLPYAITDTGGTLYDRVRTDTGLYLGGGND